jgi:phosphonate transport system permease protein
MARIAIQNAPVFAEPVRGGTGSWKLPIGVLALLLWAGWTSGIDLRLLVDKQAWSSLADFLHRLFPPDLSPGFLKVAFSAVWTTVATALVATALATTCALPLAVLASGRLWRVQTGSGERVDWRHKLMASLSWLAIVAMGAVRSIPDLVWALFFVAGLGLGRLAGTLALAVSYTALLGRVYADIFDVADVRPLEAMQSLGATRLQVLLFGILPQSRALLTSYTLYSFECSVRSAAVLGFVGAGGLGQEISLSMRLFEFGQVFTLLGCFVFLLFLVDLLSRSLRASIKQSPRLFERHRFGGVLAGLLVVAAIVLSLPASGLTSIDLLASDTLGNLGHFAGQLLKPELSLPFSRELGHLVAQTLSISILGTVFGSMLGFLLALPGTRMQGARLESLHRTWLSRMQAAAIAWLARMMVNLLRAIPELVWVPICILAVGFGPFAGAIAIGLHTGGVLGKLFAEAMEEGSEEQVEAVMAMGASRLQCLFWTQLPQAWPMMRRYILLRWDMNLRAATILGLVGGGGLGQALYNSIQLGDYSKVSTLTAAMIVFIVGSDWLSQSGPRAQIATQ